MKAERGNRARLSSAGRASVDTQVPPDAAPPTGRTKHQRGTIVADANERVGRRSASPPTAAMLTVDTPTVDTAATAAVTFATPKGIRAGSIDTAGLLRYDEREAVRMAVGFALIRVRPSTPAERLELSSVCTALLDASCKFAGSEPERLLQRLPTRTRHAPDDLATCEYLAASLRVVAALAQRREVSLVDIVGPEHATALVGLVAAAQALRHVSIGPALGAPLTFFGVTQRGTSTSVRAGNIWTSARPALEPGEADALLAKHASTRAAVMRRSLVEIATHAAAIVRAAFPALLKGLDVAIDPATAGEQLAHRQDTVRRGDTGIVTVLEARPMRVGESRTERVLNAVASHVGEANVFGRASAFDSQALVDKIESLLLDGVADTPGARASGTRLARECLAPYVEGLLRVASYQRFTSDQDAARACVISDQLRELWLAIDAGPLGPGARAMLRNEGRLNELRNAVDRMVSGMPAAGRTDAQTRAVDALKELRDALPPAMS